MTARRTRLRSLGAAAAAVCLLSLSGALLGAAHAADDATIDHSEQSPGTLKLLVSVPGEDEIDLGSAKVVIDGQTAEATAEPAASSEEIRRTAMLAIDTSGSMAGAKFEAAKRAAKTFLETVPANVQIGIVTFDTGAKTLQQPSTDRERSKEIIDGLVLRRNTALYEGVRTALAVTGKTGQRQVLVLSDGNDTTKTSLQSVIAAIKQTDVKIDVVALEQGASAPAPLLSMAQAGNGEVISTDAEALEQAFTNEADALARQILVTAKIPEGLTSTDASVEVSLDAGEVTHSASAFVAVQAAAPKPGANAPVVAADEQKFVIPESVMYGAVAAIGIGAIGVIGGLLFGTGGNQRPTLEEQFSVYSATGARASRAQAAAVAKARQSQAGSLADQARQAAENVLANNASFEAKVAHRLEGAGLALKSSEWLLLHFGIAFLAGLLGLLITAGNALGLLLFLLLGAVGPWVYLAIKRSRRLKAFDASLADTLQLMSGSLSAGLSLAQSMDTIVREGTEPITSEFKRVIVESRLGVGLEDALEGVAERMQSTDFKWVVMAIRIQREVGGNLAELLLTVAATLREREYIRRHVRALSAEGRLSCWILGALPPGFLGYLSLTRPSYVEPMYTTPLGWLMCGLMAVLLSVGIFWMSKVAKVEV